MPRRRGHRDVRPSHRPQRRGRLVADGEGEISLKNMSRAIVEEFVLTKVDGCLAGEDTGPVRRHGILDGRDLDGLQENRLVEIVAFGIKEKSFDQRAGVGRRGRIARAEAAVNILQRLLLVFRRILLENLDDNAVISRDVDNADLLDSKFGDLFDNGLGKRLKSAGLSSGCVTR